MIIEFVIMKFIGVGNILTLIATCIINRGSKIKTRVTLDTLRPLPQFLGVAPNLCLSAGAFTPPASHFDKSTAEKIRSRITLNFAFFLTNYVFLAVGVGLVVALSNPKMLVSIAVVVGLWLIDDQINSRQIEFIIKGINIFEVLTPFRRWCILVAVSIIVGVSKCLIPLLSWLFISVIITLLHAGLRDPKHIESSASFYLNNDLNSEEEDEMAFTKSKLMEGVTNRRQEVV